MQQLGTVGVKCRTLGLQEGFRAIPLASLRLDTLTDFDIYIRTSANQPPVLFREKHLPFTASVLAALEEHRHEHIFVPGEQDAEYRRYVERHLDAILTDQAVPVEEKSEVLYSSALGLVAEVLEDPRSGELIQRSKDLVASTTDFMMQEEMALESLLRLVSYDYYTYTHSVNVFVFSFALAQRVGFTDPALLREFGEGALLHDIGKSLIDPAIVNCRGKLTEAQWVSMKMHPVYGHDLLKEQEGLGGLALDVVRHHHEKMRGGGYPDGLSGDEISPLVRVSTIADIFDALTTRRTYKSALNSYPALKLMKEEILADLDQEYFRIFVSMMGSPRGC